MSDAVQPQDIHIGETISFDIDILNANGRPFDLTGFDKFKVCFAGLEITEVANANGSVVAIGGGPEPKLGILNVKVTKDDTKALDPDERLPLDWEIDVAASPSPIRKRINDAINVIDHKCSVS